jgi:hypothetical protein
MLITPFYHNKKITIKANKKNIFILALNSHCKQIFIWHGLKNYSTSWSINRIFFAV